MNEATDADTTNDVGLSFPTPALVFTPDMARELVRKSLKRGSNFKMPSDDALQEMASLLSSAAAIHKVNQGRPERYSDQISSLFNQELPKIAGAFVTLLKERTDCYAFMLNNLAQNSPSALNDAMTRNCRADMQQIEALLRAIDDATPAMTSVPLSNRLKGVWQEIADGIEATFRIAMRSVNQRGFGYSDTGPLATFVSLAIWAICDQQVKSATVAKYLKRDAAKRSLSECGQ